MEVPTDRDPLLTPPRGGNNGPESSAAEAEQEEDAVGGGWKVLRSMVHRGELLVRGSLRQPVGSSSSRSQAGKTTTGTPPSSGDDEAMDDDAISNSRRTERASFQQQRQEALQSVQSQLTRFDFTLTQCVLAMLLYMGLAVVAFSGYLQPEWTMVDAAYFAVVTFTTIGYGDVVPTTASARVFSCFFALSGVAVLGIALGVVGSHLVDTQNKAMERARQLSQYNVVSIFASATTTTVTAITCEEETAGPVVPTEEQGLLSEEQREQQPTRSEGGQSLPPAAASAFSQHPFVRIILQFLAVLCVLLVFAMLLAKDPGVAIIEPHHVYDWQNILQAFYYTIVTSTTIGYGDFSPTTQLGRFLATCFIPIAVGSMGYWLSMVASSIVEQRQSASRRQFLETHELTMRDIEIMDDDGDGNVTRAEFLEFMLIAMGKVEPEFIQDMHRYFERLDASGSGTLSKEDLIVIAKRKIKSPQRKLELALYKQRLLDQAEQARPNRHERGSSRSSFFLSLTPLFRRQESDEISDG